MNKNRREYSAKSLFVHQIFNILNRYFQTLELITSKLAILEDVKTTCCVTKMLNALMILMFSSRSQSYNKVLISNKVIRQHRGLCSNLKKKTSVRTTGQGNFDMMKTS